MDPTGSNDTNCDLASQQLNAEAEKESGSLQNDRGSLQKGRGSHQKGSGSLQTSRGSCSNRYESLSDETDVESVEEDADIGAASAALSAGIEAAEAAEAHGTEEASAAQDEGFAPPCGRGRGRGRGRPPKNPDEPKNPDKTYVQHEVNFVLGFRSNAQGANGDMLKTHVGDKYNPLLCQTCLTMIIIRKQQKNPSFCSNECFLVAEKHAIGAVVCALQDGKVLFGKEMRGRTDVFEFPGGGRETEENQNPKENPNRKPKKGDRETKESTKRNAVRELCEEMGLTDVDVSSVPMFLRVLWYRKGKGQELVCYFVYILRMVGFNLEIANEAIQSRKMKSDDDIDKCMKELNQIIAVPLENLKANFTKGLPVTDTSGQLVTRISNRWRNFFMNEASLEMLIALSADQSVNALEIHPGKPSYLFEASQLPLKYKL